MELCLLESDIAYLELNDTIAKFNDFCIIQNFTEDGDTGSNKLVKMIDTMKKKLAELFEKIKDTLSNLFKGNKVSKLEKEIKEDSALESKKIEALDSKKLYALTSSYKKKIMNAKSESEIDDIIIAYKSNQRKCFLVVSAVVALGIAKGAEHVESKFNKEANDAGNELMNARVAYNKGYIDRKTFNDKDFHLSEKEYEAEKKGSIARRVAVGSKATSNVLLLYPMVSAILTIYTSAAKLVEKNSVDIIKKVEKMTSKGKDDSESNTN
jgi:hypothetical protein